MEKCRARQAKDDSVSHAHCMLDILGYQRWNQPLNHCGPSFY